jgi:ornithine cyclodeaminase/alanine dehydrogenase-like protein (mu-crystallin family)
VDMPPTVGVLPKPGSFIHAMPAYVPQAGAVGCKWVTVYASNIGTGYDLTMGLLILNDVEYGAPRCVMDSAHITALRTGAVTGIGAKYLARSGSQILAVLGAGKMSRMSILAVHQAMPSLRLTRVFDIRPEAAVAFREEMQPQVFSEIIVANSAQEAVEGSDIATSATRRLARPDPFIKNEWLKPGGLALPLDSDSAWEPAAVLGMDKFVADDWANFENQTKGNFPMRMFLHGQPKLYAELGEIVCGKRPGRETERERILNMNKGMGIEDVTVGKRIYEQALERGVGTTLPLY